MSIEPPWERLRESRGVQAVLVYLAGAWVALQVVTVFTQAYDWPRWVMRVSIAVLAVGLVVTGVVMWARGRAREHDEERSPDEPVGRPALAGAAAIGLLLAGFAVWALVRDDGTGLAPSPALAGAAPGLAIVPFQVNDPELERWREGMVDLLSTNLDGAVGLRSIDSRTVLARWRETVGEDDEPDLPTTLAVARSAGGRYGLVGSVVSSGASMRVTAEVYDLEGGESLGERQVEGSPDSIFGLVDRLSVEVLEVLLEREGGNLPEMDLARVTTPSLTALKSFLDGESRLRQADFESAIPAYEDAVEADSAFALAHYRLGSAHGWLEGTGSNDAIRELASARRYADRLPERERNLLDVSEAYFMARPDADSLAREAYETYPDDTEASYLLGEVRFHVGYQSLATREMVEEPFVRALELDPGFVPAYIHLLDVAFQYADSVAADTLLARYHERSAHASYDRRYETLFTLAFGDTEAALSGLDSLAPSAIRAIAAQLGHPRLLDTQARAIARLAEHDGGPQDAFFLAVNLFRRGRLEAFRTLLASRDFTPVLANQLVGLAVVFDAPTSREWTEFRERESEPAIGAAGSDAMFALERGDRSVYERRVSVMEELRENALADGDSATAAQIASYLRGLRGRALMLEERDAEAVDLLERAFRRTGAPILGLWLAEANVRLARVENAIRVLRVLGPDPWISERLAPLYEQVGDTEAAIRVWSWRVVAWEEADPVLRDEWTHARSEMARLRGLQRT